MHLLLTLDLTHLMYLLNLLDRRFPFLYQFPLHFIDILFINKDKNFTLRVTVQDMPYLI